jgi:hypothetical protein
MLSPARTIVAHPAAARLQAASCTRYTSALHLHVCFIIDRPIEGSGTAGPGGSTTRCLGRTRWRRTGGSGSWSRTACWRWTPRRPTSPAGGAASWRATWRSCTATGQSFLCIVIPFTLSCGGSAARLHVGACVYSLTRCSCGGWGCNRRHQPSSACHCWPVAGCRQPVYWLGWCGRR